MTSRTSGLGSDTHLPVIPAPRDPECPLAPPSEFAQWRKTDGLRLAMNHGRPTWVVSRYQDIRAALVDPRLSADTIPAAMKPTGGDDAAVMFPRIDDPEHHRLRLMMTRDFTVRRAEAMRPQIQGLVDQHLDAMVDHGPPTDLVTAFALPIPSLVISLMLGVAPEDLELFQRHTTTGLDMNASDEERMNA